MKKILMQSFGHEKKAALLALIGTFGLSACGSPVPVPTSYPLTFQPKMQSAAHWQVLAQDVWQEVSDRLEAGGYHETSIGLEPPLAKTPFNQGLNNFLYTEIINHGVAVSPNSDFTLTYDVQVVHYAHDRDDPVQPGIFTAIAGGGALAGIGVEHGWGAGSAAAAGVPLAAAADLVNGWEAGDSLTELIVTFSVTDGNSVRLRESKVYYVNDGDADLYESESADDAKHAVSDHLVASNWYALDPSKVEKIGYDQDDQFTVTVDKLHGPTTTIEAATHEAAKQCAVDGRKAKYISQSFPSNDRTLVHARFQCI